MALSLEQRFLGPAVCIFEQVSLSSVKEILDLRPPERETDLRDIQLLSINPLHIPNISERRASSLMARADSADIILAPNQVAIKSSRACELVAQNLFGVYVLDPTPFFSFPLS